MVIIPTLKYKDLECLFKSMGFISRNSKKGTVWKGISPINNQFVRISIHVHSGGRDIPNGLFNKYIKQLGFKSFDDFITYRDNRLG